MMSEVRNVAYYIIGVGLICLSAALIYFTFEVARFRQEIPTVLLELEKITSKTGPLVTEMGEIRVHIPNILSEIEQGRALVLPVLNEATEYRKQIPLILEEVRHTRQQLPAVLNEVKEFRKQLPGMLKSVDKASNAVVTAANEIKATRPIIPEVLAELEKTRKIIPQTLDRVDGLIAEAEKTAEKTGRKASKGAVTGVITGIITSPFTLFGKIGEGAFSFNKKEREVLTDKDVDFIKGIINKFLTTDEEGNSQAWSNAASGHHGNVTLKSIDYDDFDERECRTFLIEVWEKNKAILKKRVTLCETEDGKWERM